MNDVLEMWSLPWHALQRKLAQPDAATGRPVVDSVWRAIGNPTVSAGASWLARAQRASGASSLTAR